MLSTKMHYFAASGYRGGGHRIDENMFLFCILIIHNNKPLNKNAFAQNPATSITTDAFLLK